MADRALPTRLQGLASTVLLLWLSLALAPVSALFTVLSLRSNGKPIVAKTASPSAPTALVNGARMQKSLYIARALARQGWRVVVVEERGWGLLSPARFSSFVSEFVLVPSGGGQAYIDALIEVARTQKARLFVPCSGAGTTHEDAIAADILRRKDPKFKAIIQDPDLVLALHEKDKFISLVQSYGLSVPQSVLCESPEALLDLLKSPNQPPRILKCAAELDDLGRSDLTLYPFKNSDGETDWASTEQRLRHGLGIPITSETPYLAQEFVGGRHASEWCTHSTVVGGKVRAFVCCPSNDMLMTYYSAGQEHPISHRALKWTHDFMARVKKDPQWAGRCLDGHYSFDFIHQPKEGSSPDDEDFYSLGRLVAIECNPRVHTAVGLISNEANFGAVYGQPPNIQKQTSIKAPNGSVDGSKSYASAAAEPVGAPSAEDVQEIVTTHGRVSSMSWIGHDLPARLLPLVIPAAIRKRVHPLWMTKAEARRAEGKGAAGVYGKEAMDLDAPGDREASWDSEDPWPFFTLYHFAWPYLLLRQVIVRRRAWSRINASTARIFEC